MKLGFCLPHYGPHMDAARIREFAERVEDLGFDSLWVTDHIIVPAGLDIIYKERMLEPLATLTYLAGVTRRLTLGTSVIILPYRNPVVVAKAVATADALSGGRVIFGCAAGWMEGEFRALNADFARRGDVTDECLRVIQALWTNPQPNFKSERFDLSEVVFSPAPAQQPHPPIWIGGRSRRAIRRAVELGDGWHSNSAPFDELADSIAYLQRLSARRGRSSPPEVSLRARVAFTDEPSGRSPMEGSPEQIAGAIARYGEMGVTHVAVSFPDAPFDQALADLERFATEVSPAVAR